MNYEGSAKKPFYLINFAAVWLCDSSNSSMLETALFLVKFAKGSFLYILVNGKPTNPSYILIGKTSEEWEESAMSCLTVNLIN